jgi:predicted transposase/invertase (TIGR01784 family)
MQYVINDEFIRQAREEYDEFVMDPAQQAAYDAHEKWLHDYATNMHHAKEEGKQEALTETVRKMKAAGFSPETIRDITGYSEEEIAAI